MRKVLAAAAIGMGLSLFQVKYVGGGCWLGSCPSYFGRGFPLPYLAWKTFWPEGVEGSLTGMQIVYEYPQAREFWKERSLGGVVIDAVFWLAAGGVIVKTGGWLIKGASGGQKKTMVLGAAGLTLLTVFLTSWDAGEGVTITRGAPLGYLNRYPTASPSYWSKYPVFNPFTFTVDGVVMWTIITAGYKLAGGFKRNQRGKMVFDGKLS